MTGPATRPAPVTGTVGPNGDVPDGTAADVLAWVGDDPTRAQTAYDVEIASEKPRTTLLADLERKGATS